MITYRSYKILISILQYIRQRFFSIAGNYTDDLISRNICVNEVTGAMDLNSYMQINAFNFIETGRQFAGHQSSGEIVHALVA